MTKLILGVLLWSVMHLVPAAAADFRKGLLDKLGEKPYKAFFALIMLFSLYLVISGWRSTVPENLYLAPDWGRHLTMLLVLTGFILFGASHGSNNIKRLVRHPQLTGLILWGIGHLLSNGETRSLVLFGGLTAWAIIEILFLNRRDGAWVKPEPVPVKKDIITVVVGIVIYVVVMLSHRWITGIPLIA